MDIKILFLLFKRPDVTAQVFDVIRQVRPAKLYIAADGARTGQAEEAEKVLKTRQIVLNGIDWTCEVKTLFRDANLGCRMAVSSAIDWFFEHEEEGIILEDDCLPDLTFFRYCQELLCIYRNDMRIMAISGDNFQQGKLRGKYSYYFSQLPHCWGWATWRRAWQLYNLSIKYFDEIISEPSYREFTHHKNFNKFRYENIMKAYRKEIDSWAYLWGFATTVNHGLTILPQKNLVTNIGFGNDSTHTFSSKEKKLSLKSESIFFPLGHPPYICLNKEADNFYYDNILGLKEKKSFFRIILENIL
jgi:hypothetical protein